MRKESAHSMTVLYSPFQFSPRYVLMNFLTLHEPYCIYIAQFHITPTKEIRRSAYKLDNRQYAN